MENNSSDTVSEIVANATTEPDDPFDEDAADVAIPEMQPDKFTLAHMDRLGMGDSHAPSIAKAREVAKIPPHFAVKDLVGIPILVWSKEAQKAALPDTGELRDGYFCVCRNEETRMPFTTWIGQTALRRDLAQLILPFTATIVKHGRTYRFE